MRRSSVASAGRRAAAAREPHWPLELLGAPGWHPDTGHGLEDIPAHDGQELDGQERVCEPARVNSQQCNGSLGGDHSDFLLVDHYYVGEVVERARPRLRLTRSRSANLEREESQLSTGSRRRTGAARDWWRRVEKEVQGRVTDNHGVEPQGSQMMRRRRGSHSAKHRSPSAHSTAVTPSSVKHRRPESTTRRTSARWRDGVARLDDDARGLQLAASDSITRQNRTQYLRQLPMCGSAAVSRPSLHQAMAPSSPTLSPQRSASPAARSRRPTTAAAAPLSASHDNAVSRRQRPRSSSSASVSSTPARRQRSGSPQERGGGSGQGGRGGEKGGGREAGGSMLGPDPCGGAVLGTPATDLQVSFSIVRVS